MIKLQDGYAISPTCSESPEKTKKSQLTSEFQWMSPYLNELNSLSESALPCGLACQKVFMSFIVLSDVPMDLRVANEPLLDRLSTSTAGFPGDDIADLRIVRDHWIRTKAQELALKGTYGIRSVLGTTDSVRTMMSSFNDPVFALVLSMSMEDCPPKTCLVG